MRNSRIINGRVAGTPIPPGTLFEPVLMSDDEDDDIESVVVDRTDEMMYPYGRRAGSAFVPDDKLHVAQNTNFTSGENTNRCFSGGTSSTVNAVSTCTQQDDDVSGTGKWRSTDDENRAIKKSAALAGAAMDRSLAADDVQTRSSLGKTCSKTMSTNDDVRSHNDDDSGSSYRRASENADADYAAGGLAPVDCAKDDHDLSDGHAASIVSRIASYLSLSDAESMSSIYSIDGRMAPRDLLEGSNFTVDGEVAESMAVERVLAKQHRRKGPVMSTPPRNVAERSLTNDSTGVGGTESPLPLSPLLGEDCAMTPPTPGLVAISPPDTPPTAVNRLHDSDVAGGIDPLKEASARGSIQLPAEQRGETRPSAEKEDSTFHGKDEVLLSDEDEEMQMRLQRRHREWVQRKLSAAVLSHPKSVRSYCLTAHRAAVQIQRKREERALRISALDKEEDVERGPAKSRGLSQLQRNELRYATRRSKEKHQRIRIFRLLVNTVLRNVPLSVLIDLSEGIVETGVDTTVASVRITTASIRAVVSALCSVVSWVWDTVTSFNPFELIKAILTLQRNAVGKTSEALVSGIQSVATGVGSAGTAAIHHLSRSGTATAASRGIAGIAGGLSSSSLNAHGNGALMSGGVGRGSSSKMGSGAAAVLGKMGLRRNNVAANSVISNQMFRKLNRIDSTAKVISYIERQDEALTQHAKKRVQRMMHYHVSLKPFVATVVAPSEKKSDNSPAKRRKRELSFENIDFPSRADSDRSIRSILDPRYDGDGGSTDISSNSSECSSPQSSASTFMCTPKSFPPTPSSRSLVMARGTRFAEDVVFFARDQLRVEDGLNSSNAKTRAMAKALREGKRLAVFSAADAGSGIALTCGQHCATKVGNVLYCSTRSMIPILRNCFVYFEMSVSTPPMGSSMLHHQTVATLSIGLSTLEMPLNTLVGAWKGSVGLCTTGQILAAGQWCSPLDPRRSSYGNNSTVGCLVCLDDASAFETWDGVMVTSAVTFNVDGNVVTPPVCAAPMAALSSGLPAGGMPLSVRDGAIGYGDEYSSQSNRQQQQEQKRNQFAPPTSTLPLFVPREEELFPTLTLHSPATRVMCRFCAEDIVATSRSCIGAPRGVTIYAVDGSVIFDEDIDELSASDREEACDDSLESLGTEDD